MSKTKVSKMAELIAGVIKDARPGEVEENVAAIDLEPEDVDTTVLIRGVLAGKVKAIKFEADKVTVTLARLDNGHPEGITMFPDDTVTLVSV